MSTRNVTAWWLKLLGASVLSLAFAFASPAIAQDEADDEAAADEEDAIEEILVTGSRLKRTTYSSVAPLQILTAEVSREVGLIDPAAILQESTAVSGTQIDLSFVGKSLDNGPGSSTLNLRGLGDQRTLVLINGRRAAPAGVQGAPYAFSLNLIPGSLVNQYDVLLDGASSVYGSDAVAGVTNVIMRKDFDGLELEAYTTVPQQDEGIRNVLSAVWGKNFDRGFVGVGVEYSKMDNVRYADREWTADCNQHYEVDENGVYREREQYWTTRYLMRWNECATNTYLSNALIGFGPMTAVYDRLYGRPDWGMDWLLYESWGGNTGIPGWTAWRTSGAPVDVDQDGYNDTSFIDHDGFTIQRNNDLYPDWEQVSAMAYGEYTLEGERNITPFFEVLYAKSETRAQEQSWQLFPWVPPGNPYNPCNPDGVNGVDCGSASLEYWMQDGARQSWIDYYGYDLPTYLGWVDSGGNWIADPADYAIGAQWVNPLVSIKGDRDNTATDIQQTRVVAGVRGDLPNWTFGEMSDWTWEVAISHSESKGVSVENGTRGDRLNLALGNYSATGTPCDNSDDGWNFDAWQQDTLEADVEPGCVPVNLFSQSVTTGYEGAGQGLFSPEEAAYLFDSRMFDTRYTQQIFTGFLTGTLFEVPAGSVAAGLGIEYRKDELKSLPDAVAEKGLFWGYSADGGASGEKDTKEAYAEIEFPILVGRPLAEELTLNLSTRYTKDEFYGAAWTYSGKVGYRPMENLLLRATYGTSYRAPNMRENFLEGQTKYWSISDPCRVPGAAWDNVTQTYDPGADTRPDYVLDNCRAAGVDPTSLGGGAVAISSVEYASAGQTGLTEETSDSVSAGFVWSQPFWEGFDLTIGATYYRIQVYDTIVEPSPQYVVNDCYWRATGDSTFCDRISRYGDNAGDDAGLISFISAMFLNRDQEKVEGVDVNVAFDKSVTMFGRAVDLGIDFAANRPLERSENFVNEDGSASSDDDAGEFGYPTWKSQLNLRAEIGDYRFTWSANFIGAVDIDIDARQDWSHAYSRSDTCLGPPDDVLCKDKTDVGKYSIHSASIYYRGDRWVIGGGIRNVFDEPPPRVDFNTPIRIQSNTPIGYGYDLNGRTYFFNVQSKFDF